MTLSHRAKIFFLALGDLAALYLSLFAALYLRYQAGWQEQLYKNHFVPFTVIFAFWIVVFYIAGLYDLRRLRNNLEFVKILALTLAVNAVFAILFFYLIPIFGITPKTNLFIFIAVVAVVMFFWRRYFNRFTALSQPLAHLTLVGESEAMQEMHDFLKTNPQFGFKVHKWIKESELPKNEQALEAFKSEVTEGPTEILVVVRDLKREPQLARTFYELFAEGIVVHDIPSLYEEVFRKIPLTEVSEEWFLEQIVGHHRFYDSLKRAMEAVFSIILFIILSPILLLTALAVWLSSAGPIIYKQTRVGINGKPFTLYKFRSMRVDAEKEGAQWASHRDPRSTPVGHFLRVTHLDELAQLVNILKGDLSFVGPRPERPEFVEKLKSEIPYYGVRLLIHPGVTGWAQLHYHKDQTAKDVMEKLKYDIYYLKNRSLVIDAAIIIKTVKTLFATPQ